MRHSGEEVVFLGAERRIGGRPGRDYARDLAPHQFLCQPRILHLLANGDLESFANQLGNVVFRGVIGHAAHGDGDAFFLVARSQRDLQFARGDHRIFEEKLVEIAQAEEQQSACGCSFLMAAYCRINGVEGSVIAPEWLRGL